MPKRPKNDLATLARAARQQLIRAERLGHSLDVRMKAKMTAADGWIPDEDWRRDFATVTTTLRDAGASLTKALENNKKDLGGMKTEQLEAQFKAEMMRSAETLSEEDWAYLNATQARLKAERK